MLKKVLLTMDPKDAEYYMKRCVDSGMWVPGAGDDVSSENGEDLDEIQDDGDSAAAAPLNESKPAADPYELD